MFGIGKNNAAIDAFALEICGDLAKRFPQSREAELGGDRGKVGVTLGKALADLQRRVAVFQSTRKLGIYGKARLLRAIRSELQRLQYSATFVAATTDLLVNTVAAPSG